MTKNDLIIGGLWIWGENSIYWEFIILCTPNQNQLEHNHSNKSQVLSITVGNQIQGDFKVLQGEHEVATDNKRLGNFDLVVTEVEVVIKRNSWWKLDSIKYFEL